MQKYWKGTRTLSACKSAFSHSELSQMKYIILTSLAFIQVTCPAHSLLSHKFRLTQTEADLFPTGGAWAAGTRRSGQSRPCDATVRDVTMISLLWEPLEGTQLFPWAGPAWLQRWHPSPRNCRDSVPREQQGFPSCSCSSLRSLFTSTAPAAQGSGLVAHPESIHHPEH